jgi:putative transposase
LYLTRFVNVNNADVKDLNKLSADVWNHCVLLDAEYYINHKRYLTQNELQNLLKGFVKLHSKNIQHIILKYNQARTDMFNSIKLRHKNSRTVKLPYKHKNFMPTGWDYQAFSVDYESQIIRLGSIKGKAPIFIKGYNLPQNIVEIELVYDGEYRLSLKYKIDNNVRVIQSNNSSAIDLGEIHAIASIDNNRNAIIITGRKLRSISRLRNKEQGRIRQRMSKTVKGSKQNKKYRNAISSMKFKNERQTKDCVHKITKHYVNYCVEHNVAIVYYGDLDSSTRNTKKGGKINRANRQKLSQWNYGQVVSQLQNKLLRFGVKMVKVKEYNTTKKCPVCETLNKTKGREYKCKCGYKNHRDLNGAINILNDNNCYGYKINSCNTFKYLRA